MRPIDEIADDCLKMEPKKPMSWSKWWKTIVQDGEVPKYKTWAYHKWMQERNNLKKRVNEEIAARCRPERLFCPGPGRDEGLFLVDRKDISEVTANVRVKKMINCFKTSHREWDRLSKSKYLCEADRKMLSRLSHVVELQQNTLLGTVSRMRSLPSDVKERLMDDLGCEM